MEKSLLRKTEFDQDLHPPFSEQVFVRSQSVVSRCIAGETLIVPVRGKVGDLASIYSFNQTGSVIWQALESPRSLAELIGAVEAEYAVEHEQAVQDATKFLNEMLSVGLAEVSPQVALAALHSTVQEDLMAASD